MYTVLYMYEYCTLTSTSTSTSMCKSSTRTLILTLILVLHSLCLSLCSYFCLLSVRLLLNAYYLLLVLPSGITPRPIVRQRCLSPIGHRHRSFFNRLSALPRVCHNIRICTPKRLNARAFHPLLSSDLFCPPLLSAPSFIEFALQSFIGRQWQ